MLTTQTYMGKWWIPNNEEDVVSGILTIYENGEAILETIGLFDEENLAKHFDYKNLIVPTIFGILSNNKEVSLLSCDEGFNLNLSCSFGVGKFTPRVLVIGKHLYTWDDIGDYDVCAKFDELSLWRLPHNIKQTIFPNKKIVTTILVDTDSVTVEINKNTKLKLESDVKYSSEKYLQSVNMSQGTALRLIHNNPISLQDAHRELFEFEQFLSFATLSHVQYAQFQLIDKNQISEDNPNPTIDIYEKREQLQINDSFWNYLFTYDTIKDEFPRIIQKWYSEKDLNLIRSHLIESVCDKSFYTGNLFLLVIQALDGFYCRFRKDNVDFRVWLNALTKEFADIGKMEKLTEQDIMMIHDTRDFYSHLLPEGKKKHVATERELECLTFKLRKLLLCCILNFVGFDNSEIDNIFRKSNSLYLNVIDR